MNLDTLAPFLAECPYPPQLAHIDRGILGRGFYPAAKGFHNGDDPLGGIMFLGRDWGSKLQYEQKVGPPTRDESASTWRNTRDIHLPVLTRIPVWCTNYLLGVRTSGSALKNVRDQILPGAWLVFEEYCWNFLQKQVLLQRPRLVVVFGGDNREDLEKQLRLGVHRTEFFQHTFKLGSAEHPTLVTYAKHPHSLIRNSAKAEAAADVHRMRSAYDRAHETGGQQLS